MEQNEITEIDLFQLHYYLKDKSHSIDTLTLNKVESEFLKISSEVAKIFDCKLIIESKALEEGGIKSIYKILVKKKNVKYTLSVSVFVATIIGNILTNVISNNLNENKEQTELTKKLTIAQIEALDSKEESENLISEKTRLEIKNLKQKIIKDSIEISNYLKESQPELKIEMDEKELDKKILRVAGNTKIKVYKSNFYQNLTKEDKIQKISTQTLNSLGKPISEERIVLKSEFKNHIRLEEVIEPQYIEEVELEIISPVLKNDRLPWKALFNNKQISFSVDDEIFTNLILNKGLSFSNGTKLLCDLEINLKLNKNGDLKEGKKTIYNVKQIRYPNGDIVDL
jgi:hypothetical protein